MLDANLWVAHRSAVTMPWQAECLRINVDGYIDSAPDLSPDGHWLYFAHSTDRDHFVHVIVITDSRAS